MLTKLRLHNFKRFDDAEIELGDAVVFIGPNNSGKTTALQALTLWDIGLHRWLSKRGKGLQAGERAGVAVNRRDLLAVPVPSGRLLWRDLDVRKITRPDNKQSTKNVLMNIIVEGITAGVGWKCGLEFDYTNEESFYVRPVRLHEAEGTARMPIPDQAADVRIAYLPPMSGLASEEFVKQAGEISVLIGQGQTAQVLRNLCYNVCYPQGIEREASDPWKRIAREIERLFGTELLPPVYRPERSEIRMQFRQGSALLDLSSAGRGLQQTLLLLAYVYSNPRSVLLLDEPDAHLEVLRQRQTYQLIHAIAREQETQIITASHSEIVLNEAAATGSVIAFVGKPHLLTGQTSQVIKSLTTLGWDQYVQAEETGWVLYVEDATDFAILKAFAELLKHPVRAHLDRCFVHYVATNVPQQARGHFYGLQEAKPDLTGLALFDRLDKTLPKDTALIETMWSRREIENYFTTNDVLMRWVGADKPTDLFAWSEREEVRRAMTRAITRVTEALSLDNKTPWSADTKASDEVLDRIFRVFFQEQGKPVLFRKADYYQLVQFLKPEEVDPEVIEKLDSIVQVSQAAKPSQ